ncbi:hypothetical protein Shyd_88130 [Streptomyces hydrogenans]|uniref:Uncharacterized protein n=1 Tax=Streptomyces hydrogenans TaxID=1873719 RepID=A0ABQ3PQY6_9ACTN|nr:hypothetical protein GCM10018784_08410 [Streptomyces hydrogenans]GHI27442.1 hypothetical protein Shyd_88130 [Streptomyces hydrogenans]
MLSALCRAPKTPMFPRAPQGIPRPASSTLTDRSGGLTHSSGLRLQRAGLSAEEAARMGGAKTACQSQRAPGPATRRGAAPGAR